MLQEQLSGDEPQVKPGRRNLTKEQINAQPDGVIAGYWQKLASFIMHNEELTWQEASVKARKLIKDGKALSFVRNMKIKNGQMLQETKKEVSVPKKIVVEPIKEDEKPKVLLDQKVTGIKSSDNEFKPLQPFTDNYHLLLRIIPELESKLVMQSLEDVSQIEDARHLDFKVEFIHQIAHHKYAVCLSHLDGDDLDNEPDEQMFVVIDIHQKTVEAKTHIDAHGRVNHVESTLNDVTHVNHTLKKELNAYLTTWLNNLIAQGHKIEEVEDNFVPVEETVDHWRDKYEESQKALENAKANEEHYEQEAEEWEEAYDNEHSKNAELEVRLEAERRDAQTFKNKRSEMMEWFKPAYNKLESREVTFNGRVYTINTLEDFIRLSAEIITIYND